MLEQVGQVIERLLNMLHLERPPYPLFVEAENDHVGVPGLHEDISPAPGQHYPIVGTEDVPVSAPTEEVEVNPVEMITELKQEAAEMIRARVIEFRVGARTFTRTVRRADRFAMVRLKADIENRVRDKNPAGEVEKVLQSIFPTLHVRPGFVWVSDVRH